MNFSALHVVRMSLCLVALGLANAHPPALAGTIAFPDWGITEEESDRYIQLEVRREGGAGTPASVHFATHDLTAKAGQDFTPATGTLEFAPGETNKPIQIALLDNGSLDGDREFKVSLTAPQGAELGIQSTTRVLISDNERAVIIDPDFRPQVQGMVFHVAVQPDGRILISGTFDKVGGIDRAGLARLHPDGSLDRSFETTPDIAFAGMPIALQPDGKILAARLPDSSQRSPQLVRLQPSGALDPSFSADPSFDSGYEQISVGPDGTVLLMNSLALALQPDGSVHHFWRDRILDLAGDGPLAFQPDGKLLVASGNRLHRINVDGSRDLSFAPQVGHSDDPQRARLSELFPQAGGRIVIAGRFTHVNGVPRRHLARLLPAGGLDETFDPQVPDAAESAQRFGVQPDGKVLASFYLGFPSSPVIRFEVDGSIDGSFRLSKGNYFGAVQPDGKILLVEFSGEQWLRRAYGDPAQRKAFALDGANLLEVSAGGGTANILIHRLGITTESTTLRFATRDGTARAGLDYPAPSGTLTFGPLETWRFLSIPATPNLALNENRGFTLVLLDSGEDGTVLGPPEQKIAIVPPEYISIQPDGSPSSRRLRVTLAPTAPGRAYELKELSISQQGTFLPRTVSTTREAGGTATFLVEASSAKPHRIFRAARVPP